MIVKLGSTDITTYFHMRLAADGTDATGLSPTDFDLTYVRNRDEPAAKVDATALADQDTAHTDNTAIEIDGTNMPGVYRVDWPDAAFASGVTQVVLTVKCATAFTESLRVALVAYDPADTVRLGLTALPNAAADAAGGLPISDAGGLDLDAKVGALTYGTANRVNAQVYGMEANTVTASAVADGAIDAAAIANGAIDAATFAAGAIDAAALAADAGTEIAAAVLAAALADVYAANGAAPTLQQAIMAIHQHLMAFSISGTAKTVKKLNGSDTAFAETLNSAVTPTALARS